MSPMFGFLSSPMFLTDLTDVWFSSLPMFFSDVSDVSFSPMSPMLPMSPMFVFSSLHDKDTSASSAGDFVAFWFQTQPKIVFLSCTATFVVLRVLQCHFSRS
jgi:hypothetical protein